MTTTKTSSSSSSSSYGSVLDGRRQRRRRQQEQPAHPVEANSDSLQSSETTPLVTTVVEELGTKSSSSTTSPFSAPAPRPAASSTASTTRSIWSRLVFQWFTPILHRGNAKKRLDPEDLNLIPLPLDCQTEEVMRLFDQYYYDEKDQNNNNNNNHGTTPSSIPLYRVLFLAYGKDFLQAGGLKLIHDLNVFVGPQVLHSVIVFLRHPQAPLWHGLLLCAAVTSSQLLMSFCLRHYFFKCYVTGLRVRTAMVTAVYRKALTLSSSERQARRLGEITNLMSIDAQRLQELMNYLHALWYSPLQIGLALYFLWQQLGFSSLGGVLVIVVMIPVTKYIAQWMAGMQKRLMTAKDRRIELNTEVLSETKVIKLQAWEEPFMKRILALRQVELDQLFIYSVGSAISRMLWQFTPMAVAMATFCVYVLTGHQLDVASALTALALFNILRFPLQMLPRIINSTVEASVSINRIQSFLRCPDHTPVPSSGIDPDTSCGIQMNNVSAAYDASKMKLLNSEYDAIMNQDDPSFKEFLEKDWEIMLLKSQLIEAEKRIRELANSSSSGTIDKRPTMSRGETASDDLSDSAVGEEASSPNLLCLKRMDFECRPGELVAVVGGVGSGKSSFINVILGEVRQVSGITAVKGRLAYFSQTPFILNATIRENILFGHINDESINEALYQRALDCCALRHDLELLPHGDATEIGEKGITLSGGQKARVALARAVYHQADITLIDDALAAVDAHVAVQLFEQAIVGELLKPGDSKMKRSVVLVTNAIQYLNHKRVDKIVVVHDGRIVEQGSYAELSTRAGSVFSRFLSVVSDTGVSAGELDKAAGHADSVCVFKAPENVGEPPMPVEASNKRLMTEESRQMGHVSRDVYFAWFRALGGYWVPFLVLIMFTISEGMNVLSNWWLTYWSAHGSTAGSQVRFLLIYAGINVSSALIGFVRLIIMIVIGLTASRKLFDSMLAVILQAPMSFFDTTPVGRLINRFSKDMYTIDEQLRETLGMYLNTVFSVLSTIAVVSGVSPIFVLCLVPMVLYYIHEQAFFTVSYRELKRLDSTNRSPIYALLGESVDGVAVIRSFAAEDSLKRRLTSMLNIQQHAYFLTCAAQSWLAVRLELIGTLIITFATLSAVLGHEATNGNETVIGSAGLAISYSLYVTQSLNWSVRMASDLEASMVAVERVIEYSQVESEGERQTPVDDNLPAHWPTAGAIDIIGAKLRYRPGLPLVLKGLDLSIPAGSKVGVVGRTGAGKSTLMVALLRIVELTEGKILIDGQDIKQVGLAKLRSSIAVIPQDPVLFSGTVRTNLDPFDDYSDDQLYEALERVGLYNAKSIGSSSHSFSSQGLRRIESLDDGVSEGGSNFSVGQRQLLVIARALLHGSRVIIMDEATAAVDAETDTAIQKVMRLEFEKATVITVAHRINTIMDSDYILVMANGVASECDAPKSLLKKGGLFRDLVQAASQE